MKSDLFHGYLFFSRSKCWWILHRSRHLVAASRLKVSMAGMKAFHRVGQFVKPTTRMIQCFGQWATRSKIDLDDEQAGEILSGGRLSLNLHVEDGYVIMAYQGRVFGLGLYINGTLHPQLPREAKTCLSALSPFSAPTHSA